MFGSGQSRFHSAKIHKVGVAVELLPRSAGAAVQLPHQLVYEGQRQLVNCFNDDMSRNPCWG